MFCQGVFCKLAQAGFEAKIGHVQTGVQRRVGQDVAFVLFDKTEGVVGKIERVGNVAGLRVKGSVCLHAAQHILYLYTFERFEEIRSFADSRQKTKPLPCASF